VIRDAMCVHGLNVSLLASEGHEALQVPCRLMELLFLVFRQAQQRCSLPPREDIWTLLKYCWTEERLWIRLVWWVQTGCVTTLANATAWAAITSTT
jgi:hypothetical protein